MATLAQRKHLATLMRYLIAHEPQVHYAKRRPMTVTRLTEQQLRTRLERRQGAITMDCSEAVTALCKLAGLADPNGNGYNGEGYTGTLLAHLPHYDDPRKARVGALVVFGAGTGEHVCMVMDHLGPNPLLFSHGQERGPLAISLSAERQFHTGPVTFLSIAKL